MYVPSTRNTISSYDVVFHESFSSTYAEAIGVRIYVSYIPCATSSRGETGNLITFAQFEEGDLLSETCDDAESGDEYNGNLILPPLISEEEMYVMDSGDDSDDEIMSTEIL